ncbi:MAG: acyl-CoA dehydrogenase family protein [Actinomycetota bacterium]
MEARARSDSGSRRIGVRTERDSSTKISITLNQSDLSTLRQEARRFLEAECPMPYVRSGEWASLYKKMSELGWLGVAVPEERGGLGLGAQALTVLAHECGRVVAPTPFLFTASLAAPLLAATNAELLPLALSGEQVLAVAIDGLAVDADAASHIATIDERDLKVVPRDRVEVVPLEWIDLARSVSKVASPEAASFGRILAMARVAIAAESLGAAERSLEIATEYAKQRVQFGKPIGSFQAVQHLLAQMLERVELVRSAVDGAARVLDSDQKSDERIVETALIAKALAAESCVRVAAGSIQVHGGIGYTWEHDAHMYYRRTVGNAALLGSAAWCRARLSEIVLTPSDSKRSIN